MEEVGPGHSAVAISTFGSISSKNGNLKAPVTCSLSNAYFTLRTGRRDLEKATVFQTATVLCMISSLIT